MVFTTLTYLIFLTIFCTIYWIIRRRTYQNVLLLAASFIFYAWWDYRFTLEGLYQIEWITLGSFPSKIWICAPLEVKEAAVE